MSSRTDRGNNVLFPQTKPISPQDSGFGCDMFGIPIETMLATAFDTIDINFWDLSQSTSTSGIYHSQLMMVRVTAYKLCSRHPVI
jgi:hypothetical protein